MARATKSGFRKILKKRNFVNISLTLKPQAVRRCEHDGEKRSPEFEC